MSGVRESMIRKTVQRFSGKIVLKEGLKRDMIAL